MSSLRPKYPPLVIQKKFVRIPGGYLNRWLIRAEVFVINAEFIPDPWQEVQGGIRLTFIHAGAYKPVNGASK